MPRSTTSTSKTAPETKSSRAYSKMRQDIAQNESVLLLPKHNDVSGNDNEANTKTNQALALEDNELIQQFSTGPIWTCSRGAEAVSEATTHSEMSQPYRKRATHRSIQYQTPRPGCQEWQEERRRLDFCRIWRTSEEEKCLVTSLFIL